MLAQAKRLLAHPRVYNTLQRGLGADRLRYRGIAELNLADGERLLDIGCGPAFYFERLPKVEYYGFDTDQRYIDYANSRWGDRAKFTCEVFTDAHVDQLPKMDKVVLFGLLHHLSDEDSGNLLRMVGRTLAPGGRVMSIDTCYEPSQGRISRWISDNDRGEFVRPTERYVEMAQQHFAKVDGKVLSEVTRVPGSFWMMNMSAPHLS